MTGLSCTFLVSILCLFELDLIPIKTLRILAAVASCLIVTKLLDWLRLFTNTSFYVQLVEETIYGIKDFLILFILAFLMFGLPISLMNLSRDEENSLVSFIFGGWLIDALIN